MGIEPYFNMSGNAARGLLYGLVESNKIQLREEYPDMPSMRRLIQDGKVQYKRADPQEHWQTYHEIVEQLESNPVAYADCEDLASAVAAEDQVRYGVKSLPYAYKPREGLFHVVTAVPKGQYGRVPRGNWPGARGAPEIPGYVLEDNSAAAGMGSFGGLPFKEDPGMAYGRTGKGGGLGKQLGGILGSFKKGALGDTTMSQIAREAGSGAGQATGIGKDWAREAGQSLTGQFFPGASARQGPPPTGKGPKKAKRAAPEVDQDEEDDDFDEELDEIEEEEFGLYGWDQGSRASPDFGRWFTEDPDLYPDTDVDFGKIEERRDFEGSTSWYFDRVGDRVADEVLGFGATHLGDDDEVYSMGIFRKSVWEPLEDLHEEMGPRPQQHPKYGGKAPRARVHSPEGAAAVEAFRAFFKKLSPLMKKTSRMARKGRSEDSIAAEIDKRVFGGAAGLGHELTGHVQKLINLGWSGKITPSELKAFEAEINSRYGKFSADGSGVVLSFSDSRFGAMEPTVAPTSSAKQLRGEDKYAHLRPPAHMLPPGAPSPHVGPPQLSQPRIVFGDLGSTPVEDEEEPFEFEVPEEDIFGFDEDDLYGDDEDGDDDFGDDDFDDEFGDDDYDDYDED